MSDAKKLVEITTIGTIPEGRVFIQCDICNSTFNASTEYEKLTIWKPWDFNPNYRVTCTCPVCGGETRTDISDTNYRGAPIWNVYLRKYYQEKKGGECNL